MSDENDKTSFESDEAAKPRGAKSGYGTKPSLNRIKTGKFERRLGVFKLGLTTGARFAARSVAQVLTPANRRDAARRELLKSETERFVQKLGEYKGSFVKIGQMMALWGEHYLPKEVTQALHQLEDETLPMSWSLIQDVLEENLAPNKLAELDIDPTPIGTASLGQVHRARRRTDGAQLCLKVQYPGVAEAIDSDLDGVELLMRVSRFIPKTREFELWFEEIRRLLKQEVNYPQEAATTARFREHLADDVRYIVPKIYPDYCGDQVIAMSYEAGDRISSGRVLALSQERRNQIAAACLDLCWREVFEFGEMQTDPNFGNYLIRTNDDTGVDQIVLLDYGAVRSFEPKLLQVGRDFVRAVINRDLYSLEQSLAKIDFFKQQVPEREVKSFANLCYTAIEPFTPSQDLCIERPELLDAQGYYDWEKSDLANRVIRKATESAFSSYFYLPPKDFMFISRKFVGAYTLMCVLKAKLKGYEIVNQYL